MWVSVFKENTSVRFEPNLVGIQDNTLMKNCVFDGFITQLIQPEMEMTLSVPDAITLSNRLLSIQKYTTADNMFIVLVQQKRIVIYRRTGSPAYYTLFAGSNATHCGVVSVPSEDGFALVCGTDGSFNVDSVETKLVYLVYKSNTWSAYPLQMPVPQKPPLLLASCSYNKRAMEYRYVFTYYNSVANIESPPSPPVSALVNPSTDDVTSNNDIHRKPYLFGVETPPIHADKIKIYRFNEAVGDYVLLDVMNLPITNRWKWSYEDTKDVSYVSDIGLKNNVFISPSVKDLLWHIDRLYVADGSKNCVFISAVADPDRFFLTPQEATDGSVVYLNEPFRRMFSWGSHVLLLTERWIRLIEENGMFYMVPVDFPIPANNCVAKAGSYLVIANSSGVYIINESENVQYVPLNWRWFFDYTHRRSLENMVVRKIFNFIDIAFPSYVDQQRNGWEYIRIDLNTGNVSGTHTSAFWGWC